MSRLKMPHNKESAHDVMKKFSDMAYSLSHREIFQEAVYILYGREFSIIIDLNKRMQFSCLPCNKDMNSENAMAEHQRSGGHQKNLDRKLRETGGSNYQAIATNFARDSIQYKLLNSKIPAIGLQMLEEYINSKGKMYYKCILCGAHGKLDAMYHHMIGMKHTDKYIKTACVLENSVLNPNEREEIRKKLVRIEGINVDAIKTIKGDDYYPYKWEAEAMTSKMYNQKFKKERRSSSLSPEPGPSKGRRSVSGSPDNKRKIKHRRSLSRSISPVRHRSKTHRRRHRRSSSSSSSSSSRRSRSYSPRMLPTIHVKSEPVDQSDPRSTPAREDLDRYQYRNRSPPSLSRVKSERLSPTSQVFGSATPLPVPLSHRTETKDKFSQTPMDLPLEELMVQLNFIVKSHQTTPNCTQIKDLEEMKVIIDMMHIIGESLRQVAVKAINDGGSFLSPEQKKTLLFQKEKREKIISYVTKWYLPTYEKLKQEERMRDWE